MEHLHKTDVAISLTADIVTAFVSNNSTAAKDLPDLISQVHASLASLSRAGLMAEDKPVPAVAVKKSVTPDYIISLEDGRKFKSLKRHLMAEYGMTPEDYRRKWDLPTDYPMVAQTYAAKRSELAKASHFGRIQEA